MAAVTDYDRSMKIKCKIVNADRTEQKGYLIGFVKSEGVTTAIVIDNRTKRLREEPLNKIKIMFNKFKDTVDDPFGPEGR